MKEWSLFKRDFSFEKHLVKGKDLPPGKLPNTLDMSQFTPFMDELYGVDRPGFPGKVERSVTVYFDKSDSRFKMWKIQYGNEFMVGGEDPPDRKDIVVAYEMHTHPYNGFFTPHDLPRLRHEKKGERRVKAAIVLCPDMQFMVVPTSATRKHRIHIATVFEVSDECDDIIAKVLSYELRMLRHRDLLERVETAIDLHFTNEIDGLTEEEERKRDEVLNAKRKKLDGIYVRIKQKVLTGKERYTQELLVQNARNHGLEIYHATDRAHFARMDTLPEVVSNPPLLKKG